MMILSSALRTTAPVLGLLSTLACGQASVHTPSTHATPPRDPTPKQANQNRLHFDHLALMVSDLKRSAAFYGELLQLPETFDATEKDHIRWFSLGGDRQLHIIATESFEGVLGKGVHLALTTSAFDQLVARLAAQQVPFESWLGKGGESNLRPDGVKQVYLQDPDGYWIEINNASTKWPTLKAP